MPKKRKKSKKKTKAKKKFMKYMIPISISLISLIVLSGLFYYGGTHDWFKSEISFEGGSTNVELTTINLNNPPNSMEEDACSQDLDKSIMCVGDVITGTVTDGKNTLCHVYGNRNDEGWAKILEGTTDNNGVYEKSYAITMIGNYKFRSICDYNNNGHFDINDCITEIDELIVTTDSPPCPEEEPGSDEQEEEDEGLELVCESKYPKPSSQKSCDARVGCTKYQDCKFLSETITTPARCKCSDGLDCQSDDDCPRLAPNCVQGRCVDTLSCSHNLDCNATFGDGWNFRNFFRKSPNG